MPQNGAFSGNLMWYVEFPAHLNCQLTTGLQALTARGYWASTFPEGDGVAFRKDPEDATQSLMDLRACLPFLDIDLALTGDALIAQKHTIIANEHVLCTCLTPVDNLRLLAPVESGTTRIHSPVDGGEVSLNDHPWGMVLCDEPGADVMEGWTPFLTNSAGDARLLGYPLIERQTRIPARLLLDAAQSVRGAEKLIAYVAEDADSVLDPLRVAFCDWSRLEFLPNKAGWIGEFAHVYVQPQTDRYQSRSYAGKPSALRVSNNWLGLELDENGQWELAPYVAFIDGARTDDLGMAAKSALRSAGRAFYLVDPEAAFLHLVYAIDGLCEPGKLTGFRHRVWIIACTNPSDAAHFKLLYSTYDRSYAVRNQLVHRGATFASIGEEPVVHLQTMTSILVRILRECLVNGELRREEHVDLIISRLGRPDFDQAVIELIATGNVKDTKTLLQGDKVFKKVEADHRTS